MYFDSLDHASSKMSCGVFLSPIRLLVLSLYGAAYTNDLNSRPPEVRHSSPNKFPK